MEQQLFEWSHQHLGQWHYVLGYLLILVIHNWPLLLSIVLIIWWGVWLYRWPSQARVCWFYGAFLFGLAYEYHKHIAPTLHESLDTVLGLEVLWLNLPAHFVVGPLAQTVILIALTFFFVRGFWLELGLTRREVVTSKPGKSHVDG
jgi:hypothetical protein